MLKKMWLVNSFKCLGNVDCNQCKKSNKIRRGQKKDQIIVGYNTITRTILQIPIIPTRMTMLGKINYGRFGFVCCQRIYMPIFLWKTIGCGRIFAWCFQIQHTFVEDVIFLILAKTMENTTLCLFWMVVLHGDYLIWLMDN